MRKGVKEDIIYGVILDDELVPHISLINEKKDVHIRAHPFSYTCLCSKKCTNNLLLFSGEILERFWRDY